MDFSYKDNSKEILSALRKAERRGLKAIGFSAEGHAKRKITQAKAVDTGRLRNSITFALSGENTNISSYQGDKGEEGGVYEGTAPKDKDTSVYVGTNVEYAIGIELGTRRKAGAVHFLQDAVTQHSDEYRQLVEDAFKNA